MCSSRNALSLKIVSSGSNSMSVPFGSFVLPVSDPHLMIAYGTETFEVKDLMRIGIPLTVIALLLLVLFWFTYWRWLGMVY